SVTFDSSVTLKSPRLPRLPVFRVIPHGAAGKTHSASAARTRSDRRKPTAQHTRTSDRFVSVQRNQGCYRGGELCWERLRQMQWLRQSGGWNRARPNNSLQRFVFSINDVASPDSRMSAPYSEFRIPVDFSSDFLYLIPLFVR